MIIYVFICLYPHINIFLSSRTLDIELNSFEASPVDRIASTRFMPMPAVICTHTLHTCMSLLRDASSQRAHALTSPSTPSEGPFTAPSAHKEVVNQTFHVLMDVCTSVCMELEASMQALKLLEDMSGAAEKVRDVTVHAGKPEVDDSSWTPEQLAKVCIQICLIILMCMFIITCINEYKYQC